MNGEYTLAERAGKLLTDAGMTLAVAESCTGGMLGSWLTAVPGSSSYFLGGVISYADSVKVNLLGVPADVIKEKGAVSAESALAMSQGVRTLLEADIGVSITGVAGPGGGSETKPVGTTYVALVGPSFERVEHRIWHGDRASNREESATRATNDSGLSRRNIMKVLPAYISETVYEQTTLANGLRVITATMPHTRSAAVQFYIGVGARHEDPRVSGVSHFVEHMVFKGTESRPNPVQISEAIEGVGGNMNAATDHEHTNYRSLVPYNYMDTAMDVMTDMLRHSRFVPEEIAKEREVIIEEINSTYNSPGDIADMVFDEMLWGDHPLGRDVAGSKSSLKRIKREDLLGHVERHYRPDAMVISVAGNIAHENVVEQVARLWGDLSHSSNGLHIESPAPVNPSGPGIKTYRKRTEQTNLIVGVPAFPYTHPRRYTQDVLDTLLGCGMSSRLFVEIRENKGLAYSVSSFVKTYHDTGAFGVHAAVDNDRVEAALEAIMGELARVKDELVPESELRKVKEYIKGNTLLSLERSGYVAHWGGWQQLMLGRIESMDEALDKIEQVKAEQLRDLAADLFVPSKMRLAIVGPTPKDEEKLAVLLT